jgi:hypothetical protein
MTSAIQLSRIKENAVEKCARKRENPLNCATRFFSSLCSQLNGVKSVLMKDKKSTLFCPSQLLANCYLTIVPLTVEQLGNKSCQ